MTASSNWRAVEEAFLDVLGVDPVLRGEFLDQRCGGDASLRNEVEQLLAGHSRAEAVFITPPDDAPAHPARVGLYRVVRLIAAGGMGVVYEAEQESPRRSVAVKVMRAGLASPVAIRRFIQEAEVLARLRHPGIAQVYEAGVFDAVPFFAMEFIEGARTIVEFARNKAARELLDLFLRVCDAVHHGHQRGVIHRDLKPGNILVDRAGSPKIIDFGIARAGDSSADSMHTSAGQLIGTIAYMSPEQCAGDPSAIDTRTDVYSLGVVLYELLCGQTPFNPADKPILEAARSIREGQSARPSAIVRAIRGDLETIVVTAIHRDRDRRYQSVADLAADIRRFLASEPIAARPATALYQLRMFARRHRTLAVGACIAVSGLVLGMAGATWQAIRATDERDKARLAEKAAADEADTANRIAKCLQDAIASMDPSLAAADGLSHVSVLHTSAESVARELKDKPLAQAALFERLGNAYSGMRLTDRSIDMHRRAAELLAGHGASPADLARVRASLATEHRHRGDWEECERVAAVVLRSPAEPQFLGPRAVAGRCLSIALLRRHEAVDAQRTAERAIRDAVAGGFPTLDFRLSLAAILEARGNLDGARVALSEAVGDPTAGPFACHAKFELAVFEARHNRSEAAAAAFAVAIESWRSIVKSADPDAAHLCKRIAHLLESNARWESAEAFFREAIERHRELYGPRHITVGYLITHLANVLQYLDRPSEAAACYREAASILRSTVGDEHPEVGACMYHLARLAAGAKDESTLHHLRDEAALLERASAKLPLDHPHRSGLLLLTGFIDMSLGDAARAEPRLRECVRLREAQLGSDSRITVYAQTVLGGCLTMQGKFEEAEALLVEYVPKVESRYIPGSYMSREARARLVDLYSAWGKPDKAEAMR
jgi:eukaryotic-like serine/threonine-protein kinase